MAFNTGGLFNTPNTTSSLFGQGAIPITTSPSLFSNPPQGVNSGQSIFGQNPNSSLFGQTAPGQPANSTPSIFGTPPPAGQGLFSATTNTNPSLLAPNPSFGAPSTQPSLFSQNSSFFNTQSTGLFGTNPQPNLGTPSFGQPAPQVLASYHNYAQKTIESLHQTDRDHLYNLKTQLEQNENNLIQSEKTLEKILKFKEDIKLRLVHLFSFVRKVQTAEKRCKASLEIVKSFQSNINLFIRDAVKVFDRCEMADRFNPIESPGLFLGDMLSNCEERLKSIEENFKEIQELVLVEERPAEFGLLIRTIAMMQGKFELVAGLAYDMHKRVEEVVDRYSVTFGFELEEKEKKMKIQEPAKAKNWSYLADIIAGRPSSL